MLRLLFTLVFVAISSNLTGHLFAAEKGENPLFEQANQEQKDGNYKNAYDIYHDLVLKPETDTTTARRSLQELTTCLYNLDRIGEIDPLLEMVVMVHGDDWRIVQEVANSYRSVQHYGYIIGDEITRGHSRGGAQYVSLEERDRVRALQLMVQALELKLQDTEVKAKEKGDFYFELANTVQMSRSTYDSWKMQTLTDLSELPEPENSNPRFGGYRRMGAPDFDGAPVDDEGNPITFTVPESWEAAANDGQRWRWALAQAASTTSDHKMRVKMQLGDWGQSLFGVQTLRDQPLFYKQISQATDDPNKLDKTTAPYSVHTLGEDETLAQLATGIKRFTLPEDFSYIKIFLEIAAEDKGNYAEQALSRLENIFKNRRQYARAAEMIRENIKRFGPGNNDHKQKSLDQIIGNWGEFQVETESQIPSQGGKFLYRFRNGKQVHFEAVEIKLDELLKDCIEHLKSHPKQLDSLKLQFENIGQQLVEGNQEKYLGKKVAEWNVDLDPLAGHYDKLKTISAPLNQAGAYFITARMQDGNETRIVLWMNDTIIVSKRADNKSWYLVADAESGTPVPGANVEMIGYRIERPRPRNPNQIEIKTQHFAEFTDKEGQFTVSENRAPHNFNWLMIARTKEGRLAYLGFQSIWHQPKNDPGHDTHKAFYISDRPVYKPKDTVQFKFWVRNARYSTMAPAVYANKEFQLRLNDPQGKEVWTKKFTADAFGGFNGEYELPEEATLGTYSLNVIDNPRVQGWGSFRVEEYKKTEYEVTIDAPEEPVQLGEKITATIKAKYYFGAPVKNATVHFTVKRSEYSNRWYPSGTWDWLYGNGYWWFTPEWDWYPGFSRWGCVRPYPYWWPQQSDPPEVVLDQEVEIGADGSVTVEIDTALAEAMHGDQDHRYEITAEVVDESRRTIVGNGEVLVARELFDIVAWTNRGYARVGDTIEASFKAHTLNRKPVKGEGTVHLIKITYTEDGKPLETLVEKWDVATNEEGLVTQKMNLAEAGQYRISYLLKDEAGHEQEGATVLNVYGAGFDGKGFRYNDLELLVEQKEYQPGDKVQLRINTNRTGSTVLLFVRPVNGVYEVPYTLKLDGKSTSFEIDVRPDDMPNFFVEAMTISDGDIHSVTQNIVVPPEKRIMNIEVTADQPKYQPGEELKLQLKLTDLKGDPIQGSVVLSAYDKSVEYISGGSSIGDIKKFFWDFKRHHSSSTNSSWNHHSYVLYKRDQQRMEQLGTFGAIVEESFYDRGKGGFGGGTDHSITMMRSAPMSKMHLGGEMAMEMADGAPPAAPEAGAGGGESVEPTIRKDFADTAFWAANLEPDENGIVLVSFPMPDSLTTWKIASWGMGDRTRVGYGETEVITSKNLLVRLQAPRFFVETDEVVLSANIHSYLETDKSVQAILELEGGLLESMDELTREINLTAGEEIRIDWRVKVLQPGEVTLRMKALTDEESDAVEMSFPVYIHGAERMEAYAGTVKPEESSSTVEFDIPKERLPEQSVLKLRFSPSLAAAMIDALPYLANYPHKTTDAAMYRFVPTVITYNILKEMGVDLRQLKKKQTNLNAQELGDPQERAKQWKQYDKENPVYNPDKIEQFVKQHVDDVTNRQLSDGGWGWLSGYGEHSSPHITAQVVHGLILADKNQVALVPGMLDRGLAWLENYQQEQIRLIKNWEENEAKKAEHKKFKQKADNLDALVFGVLVEGGRVNEEMHAYLNRDRVSLSVYAKGLLGLALHTLGDKEGLAKVMENLEQYLQQDAENETAWLQLPAGHFWWFWYGNEDEANAIYLKLLSRTDPRSERARRLVKYILNNRKNSTYWSSISDTALSIEALAEYLKASGENRPDMVVEVWFDGQKQKEVKITPENLFEIDNKFTLEGVALESGRHTLELRKTGSGPLYYNAYVKTFSKEDFIEAAGLEIKVERRYTRLIPDNKETAVANSSGQAIDQLSENFKREPLVNHAELKSGDLIEVELIIDSKNDYEYLIFEDYKPAGLEAVDLRSGYNGNRLGAYMEFKNEKVKFFVQRLAHGKHSVTYQLRAEIPGKFSALPTQGSAMYAPELRANSDEMKLQIVD
ncbi:MG2 domain protein [Polystyrenella longa]|uniref:MG2 domain protein n=1 Tax=Polystyrenella longa TaxID=2528007 RepID=A0A518CR30_9PLAN|nr:MG2 domain-containing protein [Polystyrenella longa]QDU81689.1 MG2 domain protein [Polystyrenella longa]